MKILIIEDEPKTAQSLRAYLEEECQAEVDCAFDGYSGKRFAQQNQYDIILTDVVLPHINGIELCKQLREMGIKIPILMLYKLSLIMPLLAIKLKVDNGREIGRAHV